MALPDNPFIDSNAAGPDACPAAIRNAAALAAVPCEALARLPFLHAEARRDRDRAALLARAPHACLALMLAWGLMLPLGGAGLRPGFLWSLPVLASVAAMARNAVGGPRQTLRRKTFMLRLSLFCAGAAWGAGAFLILPVPANPALILAFALGPDLAMAMTLKNKAAALAFMAPAALAILAGALAEGWALWVSTAIIAVKAGIAAGSMLRRGMMNDARRELAIR